MISTSIIKAVKEMIEENKEHVLVKVFGLIFVKVNGHLAWLSGI